ncbi:MAG: hypothetical protein A2017_12795 [Lentisphaerae bacterium GWF2_44_16]|nr:MAG: hypothetical protein A2017_12795 [Lentisphaerae bacterium GWF2_44_16]
MTDWKGISKWELDTPCLVIDIDKLDENIKKMQDFASASGKKLRPHAKTHKCTTLAKRQLAAGSIGICAAKLSEAEKLLAAGIKNVLITSPVVSREKIRRLMKCLENAPELILAIDNIDNAVCLSAEAKSKHLRLNVVADINPEMGRTGVSFKDAFEFGKFINSLPGLKFRGIQCYAGQLQHIASYDIRQSASLECLKKAAGIFRQMKDAGLAPEIFTGTGTGTYDIDSQIPEVTELQVGSYTVMDSEYMNIGSVSRPDRFDTFKPALSILSGVVSVNQPHSFTIDAGLKAIYFNREAPPKIICPRDKSWEYTWFGDEHGKITVEATEEKPGLGTVIELTASHCDPTINLHDFFYVTQNDIVIDRWPIDLRGCCQ